MTAVKVPGAHQARHVIPPASWGWVRPRMRSRPGTSFRRCEAGAGWVMLGFMIVLRVSRLDGLGPGGWWCILPARPALEGEAETLALIYPYRCANQTST